MLNIHKLNDKIKELNGKIKGFVAQLSNEAQALSDNGYKTVYVWRKTLKAK
jgi:hypothetical protein